MAHADAVVGFHSEWARVGALRMHAVAAPGPQRPRGLPFVLVHGLGLSHEYMMPTAECLARRFEVFVPDLPGFGESEHPDRVLDIGEMADALVAWMDATGLVRAALLGNSQGCQVIIDLAARYPERIAAGVLQGPTTPPEERSWLRQFIRWRQNAPYNPPELDTISHESYRKSGYLRILRTFQYALDDALETKCQRIRVPMLVVRGQHDPICHESWAEDLAARFPAGRIVLIPRQAHTIVYTGPAALASVAAQFIEECAELGAGPEPQGRRRDGATSGS
ncbi:alpha/beta hydrolase [Trinickia symbiotica]|uniref:Alpha/beta hydrolase n=1 Tax=Trinickia symbiotica TaxID=863227 RepID=A0A2T3XZV7_9BURK|nr:alpha/beta hydrolase [Trinickia symbiotica]PTB22049.1 alpha/beta hydrolase [Trinickia symbiotica]